MTRLEEFKKELAQLLDKHNFALEIERGKEGCGYSIAVETFNTDVNPYVRQVLGDYIDKYI